MRTAAIIRWAAAGVALIGLVASGAAVLLTPAEARAAAAPPQIRAEFALPADDGGAYTPNADQIAIRGSVSGRLLLFLPATNQVPAAYRHFLDTAADAGYHVLGLDYANTGTSLTGTCGAVAACYTAFQSNKFDGSAPSRWSSVTPHDAIVNRLRRALAILRERDPRGGWGRFTDGDAIRWDRIVLAGHSQGGGESAFIAHGRAVAGVLMFGSPVESYQGVTAAWMATPGATPVDRYYALDDAKDMYADRITGSWQALGIPGDVVRVDTTAPTLLPHRMLTTVDLGSPSASHTCFITDGAPVGADGVPVFAALWQRMLDAARGA